MMPKFILICSNPRARRVLLLWLLGALMLVGVQPVLAQAAEPETSLPPPRHVLLPLLMRPAVEVAEPAPEPGGCPTSSTNLYSEVPIQGSPRRSSTTTAQDPDLNLAVRSYVAVSATLGLTGINGPTDEDAPQLAYLFRPPRVPTFNAVHQVYDWDWVCSVNGVGKGCRGAKIATPEVTLVEMATVAGEAVHPPARVGSIWGDGYIVLVLYAEEQRITLTYTREDTPAVGYVVHLEGLCVDPTLLARYRALDEAGRSALPALRGREPLGTALEGALQVAVRDTGSFMDPRSGKDWWQDVVRTRLAGN